LAQNFDKQILAIFKMKKDKKDFIEEEKAKELLASYKNYWNL